MKLTVTERAILANQFRILSKFEDEDKEYLMKKVEILERGIEWHYDFAINASNETITREVGNETMEILDMFRQIDAYIEQLPKEERELLNLDTLSFKGFDANNDSHYYFADFIINKDERYSERKGMYLNSHSSLNLKKYRAMLPVYKELRSGGHHLNLEDLLVLQEA